MPNIRLPGNGFPMSTNLDAAMIDIAGGDFQQ